MAMLMVAITILGLMPFEVFANRASLQGMQIPQISIDIETSIKEPFTIMLDGEETTVPADGIIYLSFDDFGESIAVEIPRYFYLDGERISINDDIVENVSPVVPNDEEVTPFGIGTNIMPTVGFIIATTTLPVGNINWISGDFSFDGTLFQLNRHVGSGGYQTVFNRRYSIYVNGVTYEAYCAAPHLRGPEDGGAAYQITGSADSSFIPVLRYGHPHNPLINNQNLNGRLWGVYQTRIAVAAASFPSGTWRNENGSTLSQFDIDIMNNFIAGTWGTPNAAALLDRYPGIVVNGTQGELGITTVSGANTASGTTSQSPTFNVGFNMRNNTPTNPFRFEWETGTPVGTRLYVNGIHHMTAPANGWEAFGWSATNMPSFHFVMPAGSENQTASVNLIGVNNQHSGAWVARHNTQPSTWQDITFYIHEVEAIASYTWEPYAGQSQFQIRKYSTETDNRIGGAVFRITGPMWPTGHEVTVPASGWTSPNIPEYHFGQYTIEEIAPPPSYTLSSPVIQTVMVDASSTPATTYARFTNEPTISSGGGTNSGVTIQKINALTGVNISGAVVHLRGMSSHQVITGPATPDGPPQIWEIDNTGINVIQVLTAGATTALPSGVTSTVTNGVWRLEGLPYGFYQVTEIQSPDGFSMQPGPNSFGFWVLPPNVTVSSPDGFTYQIIESGPNDNHILITFRNYPFGEVEIIKREMSNGVGNNQLLPGATFRIQGFYPGTPPRALDRTATTDANGRIIFSNLPAGNYTVTEITPPTGYTFGEVRSWSITVNWGDSVSAGTANSITAFNIPKSSLEVLKIDGITNAPLPGAIFLLRDPTTGEEWEATSSSSGIATFGVGNYGNFLYPGRTYILVEIVAPIGYVLQSTPREIVLSPGNENRITWRNYRNPGLTIIKDDMDTGERLAGAHFTIVAQGSGRPLPTDFPMITNEDGEIVIPWTLFEGEAERTFLITETVPPPGYHLADPNWQLVTVQAGHPNTVVFSNRRMPALTIQKNDAITGEPIVNTEFTIERLSPAPTGMITGSPFRTNAQGQIILPDLPAGVYRVIETRAGRNYWLDPNAANRTWTITLRENEDYLLTVENTLLPTLIITKWNALTHRPVPFTRFRVEFEVPNTGNVVRIGEFTTDTNGQIILPFVQSGWYILTETQPAPGMSLNSNPVTRIFLAPGQNTYQILHLLPSHVLNQENPGQITIAQESNTPTPPNWDTMTPAEREAYLTRQLQVTGGGAHGGDGIFNWPLNSIVIKKSCSVTGNLLPGATFEVIHTSAGGSGGQGTVIGRFTTDHSGIIVLTGLVAGSYVVREVQAPNNFTLNENNAQTVFLQPDGHSVVETSFSNDPYGSLLLSKRCSVTGTPLANAEFRVTNSNGAVVGTANGLFRTNAQGEVLIPNLPPNSYVVTEVSAPNGFILDSTPQTIRVNATGNTYRLEFTNTPKSNIIIRKVSGFDGSPLANTRFTVSQLNGGLIGEFTTDAAGVIEIEGVLGWVIVTETHPPHGYTLSVNNSRTIEIRPGVPTILEFVNQRAPGLSIEKVDENGQPLAGAEFELRRLDDSIAGRQTTGNTGMAIFPNLEPGVFIITELRAPEGHMIIEGPRTIELHAGENRVERFVNPRLPDASIRKISGDDGRPLQDVVFEVRSVSGERIQNPTNNTFEFVTDAAGMIFLPNLQPGTFIATETRALPGYAPAQPTTFTVVAGQELTLVIRNYKQPSVVIRKLDGHTDRPQQGVIFEIVRYLSNGQTGQRLKNYAVDNSYEFVTDASGHIYLPALEDGTWMAVETRPLPGFRAADPVIFSVGINGDHTIIIRNYRYPDTTIRKTDGDTGQALANVHFEIARFNGNASGGERLRNPVNNSTTFITDNAGLIHLPSMESGTWVAIETRPLPGYMAIEPTVFVVTEGGGNQTIDIRNFRAPNLTIRKIDSVTRQPIQGVVFQLARINGERVQNPQTGFFDFTTDRNGLIHLPEIEDGAFLVTEIRAAEGYFGLDEAVLLQINAQTRQQDYLLVIENTPASGLRIIKTDAHTGVALQGVEFDIRHADGRRVQGLIQDQNQPGTTANSPQLGSNGGFLTDRRGFIQINHLPAGVYHITEVAALPGYILDTTVHVVTITPGRLTTLEVTNVQMAGLRLYKVDSVTREGIPGVEFRIYDFITRQEVAGPFVTDNMGVIDFTGLLPPGRYTIQETRAAQGYLIDNMPRTVEFRAGMMTEIIWENTREAGQIQITKLSSADNEVNGLPAGSRLEGAVFEVRDWRTGNVLD